MAVTRDCLTGEELRKASAGALLPEEIERLAQHVEGCDQCAATVDEMLAKDTLTDALRTKETITGMARGDFVKALIEKLQSSAEPKVAAPTVAGGGSAERMACSQCGKVLKIKPEWAGKKVRCPSCQQVLPVPAAKASLSPQEQPTVAPKSYFAQSASHKSSPGPASGEPASESYDFLAPPQASDEIGRLGPYRVLKVLGAGGMGVVFRAEDPQLERVVALKAMLPALAASPSAKKRFLREAKTAASIKHDHIVTIYQVGEDRGAPYLAMEFLHGEALDQRLRREGRLPIAEVLRMGREVAEGLAAAHAENLIHRDIKPANVWLETSRGRPSGGDRVKILDFGLARATNDEAGLTQAGAIIGTPAYMAPEQGRGDNVDSRCDLFSLGCMLYVMATGINPFKGTDTISTLLAVATHDPTPPCQVCAEVPPELSDYILKLLEKDPQNRPGTAGEVAETLWSFEGEKSQAPVKRPATFSAASPSRRGWWIAAGLGLAALAAVVAGFVFYVPTPQGTLRVEINDPKIEVKLKNGKVLFQNGGVGPEVLAVSPGADQLLHIKRGDLDFKTDLFVLGKGDDVTLRVEWFDSGKIEVSKNGKVVQTELGKTASLAKTSKPMDPGTKKSEAPVANPFDALKREDIPPHELRAAGNGDPAKVPKELVGVFGDSRFRSKAPVYHVRFTLDGKRLISMVGAWGGTGGIEARDAATGHLLDVPILGPPPNYQSTGFNEDGSRLALSAPNGQVNVVELPTGKTLFTCTNSKSYVQAVAFSTDGRWLAQACDDKTIRICDAATGKEVQSLTGHTRKVGVVVFSTDGQRLASSAQNHGEYHNLPGELKLWNVEGGKELHSLETPAQGAWGLAFSPDGNFLASTNWNRVPGSVWDTKTGRKVSSWQVPADSTSLAWSADSRRVFLGNGYGTQIFSMSPQTGKVEETISAPYGIHSLTLSPDGKRLAAGSFSQEIWIWDAATLKPLLTPGDNEWCFALQPAGTLLASAGFAKNVKLWDIAAKKVLRSLEYPQGHVHQVAFSPDGKLLTAISGSGPVRTFDPARDQVVHDWQPGNARVLAVAYSPDGEKIAFTNGEGKVNIYDVKSGDGISSFDGGQGPINSLAFNGDGKTLAGTCEAKQRVILWDANTGKELHAFERTPWGSNAVNAVFDPNGSRLFATIHVHSDQHYVVLAWNLETKKEIWSLDLSKFHGFSPDGKTFVTSSHDGLLSIRDARTYDERRRIQLPGPISSTAFTGDGRHLLTRNTNGVVYVLRLEDAGKTPPPEVKSQAPVSGPFDSLKLDQVDPEEIAAIFLSAIARPSPLPPMAKESEPMFVRGIQEKGMFTASIWKAKRDFGNPPKFRGRYTISGSLPKAICSMAPIP